MASQRSGFRIDPATGKQIRGFAAMDPEKRREIARKGGANIPAEKRAFSRDHSLAVSAGVKGGKAPHSRRPGRPRKLVAAE